MVINRTAGFYQGPFKSKVVVVESCITKIGNIVLYIRIDIHPTLQ